LLSLGVVVVEMAQQQMEMDKVEEEPADFYKLQVIQ
jgi:hypothetical protein